VRPDRADAGFSLVEVIVAVSLIHVVMAALTFFYVGALSANHHQGLQQQATRVAADAMERARALRGAALLTGRDEVSVRGQVRVRGVDAYLQHTEQVWDTAAAGGSGGTAALPTTAVQVSLDGLGFWQHWYVAACWQTGSATDCTATNATASTAVPYLRVVVAVTWQDRECAEATCVFATSTLFSAGTDPIFRLPAKPQLVKPDIYFLSDTTGSTEPVLANMRTNAAAILTEVDAVASDPRYGAGQYRDFADAWAYRNDVSITVPDDRGAAAKAAINAWETEQHRGGDTPEANLYALHELLSNANFRAGSMRIVVWFGDAPGHDAVCAGISGEPADVTEASVTRELVAAKVTVIAVSTTTGPEQGLDDDPTDGADDYRGTCGSPGGTPGQATRITAATGGKVFQNVAPQDVAASIIAGITTLR
jgi:type II secretory pathway pseudopilin PulG